MYPISDHIKSQLKQYLEQYVERITTPSGNKRNHQYVCPLCGSGTGKNKQGHFLLTLRAVVRAGIVLPVEKRVIFST